MFSLTKIYDVNVIVLCGKCNSLVWYVAWTQSISNIFTCY